MEMNSSSQNVESTLREILAAITPSEQDSVMRYDLIQELEQVVKSVPQLRGATVQPFGSFASNLYTRWEDLDISIDVLADPYLPFAGEERKQDLLQQLLTPLTSKGGFSKLRYIPNVMVPVLELENHRGITCNISIDNRQGQINSEILLWLSQIDDRFREMVLLVKEWAKTHDINRPTEGSFNSYSLCLLVIFHFQTCVPAILPPLKEIYPGNVVDDLTGFATDAERVRRVCESNIERFKSNISRRPNTSSLDELFFSFISKFVSINSTAPKSAICPLTGTWESIGSNMECLTEEFSIIVEDPCDKRQNSCRNVKAENLERISKAFRKTQGALMQGDQNKYNLLENLVTDLVGKQILKSPMSYESDGGNNQYRTVHRSYLRAEDEYLCTENPTAAMQNEHLQMHMAPQWLNSARKAGLMIGSLAVVIGAGPWLIGVRNAGIVVGALAAFVMYKGRQEENARERDDD